MRSFPASVSRHHTGALTAQTAQASGRGPAVQVQRDVVADADSRGKLLQDHPRLHVRHPQATQARVPGTESHCPGDSAGAVPAGRIRHVRVRLKCHGLCSFCTSERIGMSLCAI